MRRIVLLGGGPSVKTLDLNRLRGLHVLGINGAAFASGARCFSADRLWIETNIKQAIAHQPIFAWSGQLPPNGGDITTWLQRVRSYGLSDDARVCHVPTTSGYGALNWAYGWGAKRILLLGYDYCSNGERHWYPNGGDPDGDTAGERALDLWDQWAPAYESTLPQLQAAGVEVLNASAQSRITAFPRCSPEEGLAWMTSST